MASRKNPSDLETRKVHVELENRIVGSHPKIVAMRRLVALCAQSRAPVLIQGPTGSGKEVVARAIHDMSGRTGPFVPVNCAAIPEDLLEAELFGHERGAYTGAQRQREGLIASADGGTLFLDEIGDMSLSLQSKILRALETRRVLPLGSSRERDVEFRLLTATHRNLPEAIAAGAFRSDLYYRIAVLQVAVPPLCERIRDIAPLLTALMTQVLHKMPYAEPPSFDPGAILALQSYSWPGNVRELRNVAERALALFEDDVVRAEDVRSVLLPGLLPTPATSPAAIQPPDAALISRRVMDTPQIDLRAYLRDIEISAIEAALLKNGGLVLRAAASLGLSRTTLIEKMNKFSILRPDPANSGRLS